MVAVVTTVTLVKICKEYKMTFVISIDKHYGGFYIFNGFTKRICLGWIAFSFIPLNELHIVKCYNDIRLDK